MLWVVAIAAVQVVVVVLISSLPHLKRAASPAKRRLPAADGRDASSSAMAP